MSTSEASSGVVESLLSWASRNRTKLVVVAAAAVGVSAGTALLLGRRAPYQRKDAVEEDTWLDFTQFLPEEVSLNIFYRCRAEDFVRASQVCREWHRLCSDDLIWKEIYQRKWRKIPELMSLHTQPRLVTSWRTLYAERHRIEALLKDPQLPPEIRQQLSGPDAESSQAELLFNVASQQYRQAIEEQGPDFLPRVLEATLIASVAGEKHESLHIGDPTNLLILWNWAVIVSTQAMWLSQLLNMPADLGVDASLAGHADWLYDFAAERYEQALGLVSRDADGLIRHQLFGDFCAELAAKRSGAEAQRYLAKARLSYEHLLERAHAVEHKTLAKTPEGQETVVQTFRDQRVIARAHSLLGNLVYQQADKQFTALTDSRSARQQREEDEDQDADVKRQQELEAERALEAQIMKGLLEARDHLTKSVNLEPSQRQELITLGDVCTLLAEVAEDDEEADRYSSEGATNFERVLASDESDTDALNEYGILLTKRAQRIIRRLRREGFDVDAASAASAARALLANNSNNAEEGGDVNAEAVQHDDGHEHQEEEDGQVQASGEEGAAQPPQTEEEARHAALMARAERCYDQAEAKFVLLEQSGVWYGIINLACLAALRGREEETKQRLLLCHERGDLIPDNLDDHDFDVYRKRPWFIELRESLLHPPQPAATQEVDGQGDAWEV